VPLILLVTNHVQKFYGVSVLGFQLSLMNYKDHVNLGHIMSYLARNFSG